MKFKYRFEWQDFSVLIIFLIFCYFQFVLISTFKQLPSPLYGGDLYHQLGAVNHVRYGGWPFKSYTNNVATPNYSPMYSLIVGSLLKLILIQSEKMMFYFSYVIMFFAMIISYSLGYIVFRDKNLALVSMLLFARLSRFPVLKYREFTMLTIWPLFILLMYKMLETRKLRYSIATGILFGIGSLSHSLFLPIVIFMLPLLFIFMFLDDFVKKRRNKLSVNLVKLKKGWYKPIILLAVLFFIGFVISLPYWYQPFFVYFGKVPNPATSLRHQDYWNFGMILSFTKELFVRFFFYYNWFLGIISSITLWGAIYFLFKINKYKFREKFILFFLIISFLLPYHFLITEPIGNFHFYPSLMMSFFLWLLPSFTAPFVLLNLNKFKIISKQNLKYIVYTTIILLVLGNTIDYNKRVSTYKWYESGKNPLPSYLKEVSEWIISNTDVEDTFIAPKEVGSAINALSGRKFISVRDNQESFISNIFQRQSDLAVILYGNNSEKQKELLKKYNVKYLYWDYYWLRAEFLFDNNRRAIGFFDPLIVPDSTEARNYYLTYGVRFVRQHMSMDPSKRDDPYVPKFDLLVALPATNNFTHPWSYTLDKYLKEIKSFYQDGKLIARIYGVELN